MIFTLSLAFTAAENSLDSITKTSLVIGIVVGLITIGGATWAAVWRLWRAFWKRLDVEIDEKLEPVTRNQEAMATRLGELAEWRVDVEYQFHPNGGLSLRDQIDDIKVAIMRVAAAAEDEG